METTGSTAERSDCSLGGDTKVFGAYTSSKAEGRDQIAQRNQLSATNPGLLRLRLDRTTGHRLDYNSSLVKELNTM